MTAEKKMAKLAEKLAAKKTADKETAVTQKGEYAALKTQKEQIAYIAKVLGLTDGE